MSHQIQTWAFLVVGYGYIAGLTVKMKAHIVMCQVISPVPAVLVIVIPVPRLPVLQDIQVIHPLQPVVLQTQRQPLVIIQVRIVAMTVEVQPVPATFLKPMLRPPCLPLLVW